MFSRRATPLLLVLLILVLPFLTLPGGFHSAQTQPAHPRPSAVADPPGTIDGAKNPELIPDEAAYQAVFLAFAEHDNATDAEKARFHAKIAAAGLSNDDEQALFTLLAAFRKQMEAVRAQVSAIMARDPMPHPDSVDYKELLDLTKQYKAVFAEAMSAVPARLSADGVARLDAHVKREKRGMKYVPDMQPPN
jgi:hypothetical protein